MVRATGRGAKLRSAFKQAEAIKLRLRGWTYMRIADELGIGLAAVQKTIDKAMAALIDPNDVDRLRRESLARLDAISDKVFEAACEGDLGAALTVLKIEARRAKLCGLDRPEKHEHYLGDLDKEIEAEEQRLRGDGNGHKIGNGKIIDVEGLANGSQGRIPAPPEEPKTD